MLCQEIRLSGANKNQRFCRRHAQQTRKIFSMCYAIETIEWYLRNFKYLLDLFFKKNVYLINLVYLDLDGWEYELQASPVDNKRNELFNEKFIQSKFATNIQTMLECYVSLHELRHSTLKEVFLQPSSQFEESIESDNFTETDRVSESFYFLSSEQFMTVLTRGPKPQTILHPLLGSVIIP